MEERKKLFLLDAYSLIYRAYYAFIKNPRYNSKGMNTSAVFGFINTLEEVLNKQNPSHIAVVFDPDTPTFRHKMYPDYKAQRPPTPEDIKKAVPYIKSLIKAYNIPVMAIDGYEADDVIGTLAKKAALKDYEVFMMTPDKDFCQLVDENIYMFKPKRSGYDAEKWGIEEVQKKFKVQSPSQVTDILALWGDTSDNIPGIPGVGEKTAIKLVGKYGSVEELYKNVHQLKGKQKENVEKSREQIVLSKKLVTIITDVPIEFDENKLRTQEKNKEKLAEIFDELEFKTLGRRILQGTTEKKANHPAYQQSLFGDNDVVKQTEKSKYDNIQTVVHQYHMIDTPEKRSKLIKKLSELSEFCFDTETTGLNPHESELVGFSFSFKTNEAYYVPVPEKRKQAKAIVKEFQAPFENEKIRKIGQNIKYDLLMMQYYGLNIKGNLFDTMIAHYLLQPELRHNLNYLSEQYLNYQPVAIESLIGKKGKNQGSMRLIAKNNPDKIKEYASEDADLTWQLKENFEKRLKNENLYQLFTEIEMPLIYVLTSMEKNGFRLDTSSLKDFSNQLKVEARKLEEEIIQLAGVEFNVASPKQLGEVLFDRMKIIPNPKKTKSKQYSTSEQELIKIQEKHEIIRKILDFRELRKLDSTYVESLPKLINAKTGKIHTSFNQAITATGRLSSNNPNLQNIPIRTEKGRQMRKAFVPGDDEHILLAADYSQIELRLMAHMSGDKNMLNAFNHNEDIHSTTAAKIFKTSINKISREQRSQAKSANFGIIYGISSFGLAQNLNISRKQAKELIDGYFESYPEVKKFMDAQIKLAREKGYVQTLKGRKRQLQDINSRNGMVRGIAERNAINAPIQGSAADIIKIAMNRCFNEIEKRKLKTKMILQVHDELIFDVPKPELAQIKEIVKREMENAIQLDVKLTVDIGTGENWLEAH